MHDLIKLKGRSMIKLPQKTTQMKALSVIALQSIIEPIKHRSQPERNSHQNPINMCAFSPISWNYKNLSGESDLLSLSCDSDGVTFYYSVVCSSRQVLAADTVVLWIKMFSAMIHCWKHLQLLLKAWREIVEGHPVNVTTWPNCVSWRTL